MKFFREKSEIKDFENEGAVEEGMGNGKLKSCGNVKQGTNHNMCYIAKVLLFYGMEMEGERICYLIFHLPLALLLFANSFSATECRIFFLVLGGALERKEKNLAEFFVELSVRRAFLVPGQLVLRES